MRLGETELRLYNYDHPPVRPLVPGDTADHCGFRVIRLLFTGLVSQHPSDGTPFNAVAESVDSTDATTFTITLRTGWTFHDGTPVTAASFVDAWNHTAYGPNNQAMAPQLEKILGYEDVHPEHGPPTTDRMRGLRVLDDHRFEVTLSTPFAIFPTTLCSPAFFPLPEAYFTDPERYLAQPVGNGPYAYVSTTGAESSTELRLTAFTAHPGPDRPRVRDLRLICHPDRDTAYRALLDGELDFLDALPPARVADGSCARDLDGRVTGRHGLELNALAFPTYLPGYDHPDLRKAVSLAIDRAQVVERALGGHHRPADGFSVAGVPGHIAGQAAPYCTYDPEGARAHLARSGFTGTLDFHSPVSAKGWLGAIAESVTRTLGLKCRLVLYDRVRDYAEAVEQRKVTGIFRSDWAPDYPALENFLRPLFHSRSPFNDSGYHNPIFDTLLSRADEAPDIPTATALYQAAERLLADDMPHVPLWQEWATAGHSPRLTGVAMNYNAELDLRTVTVSTR
ncbi:ABC transporter substrate-binding protein [Streptomyces canus]|uniref:peptide ABC transporter substrate-binding protein n=1 Tax=Streptomyces canus TaxID=58343 RepID=UPI002DDA3F70|nr:ABC transporter substrate-binding protein [Streptomyces canus]WSD85859.1 ABC transporter substrate-binding protein [Streptomyces canus]